MPPNLQHCALICMQHIIQNMNHPPPSPSFPSSPFPVAVSNSDIFLKCIPYMKPAIISLALRSLAIIYLTSFISAVDSWWVIVQSDVQLLKII